MKNKASAARLANRYLTSSRLERLQQLARIGDPEAQRELRREDRRRNNTLPELLLIYQGDVPNRSILWPQVSRKLVEKIKNWVRDEGGTVKELPSRGTSINMSVDLGTNKYVLEIYHDKLWNLFGVVRNFGGKALQRPVYLNVLHNLERWISGFLFGSLR